MNVRNKNIIINRNSLNSSIDNNKNQNDNYIRYKKYIKSENSTNYKTNYISNSRYSRDNYNSINHNNLNLYENNNNNLDY